MTSTTRWPKARIASGDNCKGLGSDIPNTNDARLSATSDADSERIVGQHDKPVSSLARAIQVQHRESNTRRTLHQSRLRDEQLWSHAMFRLNPLQAITFSRGAGQRVMGDCLRILQMAR